MFSLKNKALVLLCFRSKTKKNRWCYHAFAHKWWKSIGFTVLSLKNAEKALVLQCFRLNMLKNQWFYKQRGRKILKNHWFYCKTSPSHRQPPATSHGSGVWNSNTRLEKLWGTLTDKLFREKTCKKTTIKCVLKNIKMLLIQWNMCCLIKHV